MVTRFLSLAVALSPLACPPNPVSPPPDADADITIVDAAPKPPPPTPVDAAPALDGRVKWDVYDSACNSLALAGCPEAMQVDGGKPCAQVMRDNAPRYDMKPNCLAAAAGMPAQIRACGTVKCPGR